MKILQQKIQKKLTAQAAFSKYSDIGKIGMKLPAFYQYVPEGPACNIKLKPTKYPKSGKKLHRGMFMRPLGAFIHVYSIEDNLYIVSLVDKDLEAVKKWIDDNYNKIQERICTMKEY